TVAAVLLSVVAGDAAASALLVITLLLFGIGLGVATPSLTTAGVEAVPRARVGSAAGLLSASRYVGSIASTLLLATVVGDDGSGLAMLLGVCILLLLVSVVVVCQLPARRTDVPEFV